MSKLKIFNIFSKYKYFIDSIWKLFKQSEVPNSRLFFILFLSFLVSSFEALFIWLLAPLTSAILNSSNTDISKPELFTKLINSPIILIILIIFTLIAKSSLNNYSVYYSSRVIYTIRKQLRIKLINTILNTSWKTKQESGKLLDTYISTSNAATTTIYSFTEFLTNVLYVIAILSIFILKVSFNIIIFLIFLGILYYYAVFYISKRSKNISYRILENSQKLSQTVTEVIRGKRELQIYGMEDFLINQISSRENKLINRLSEAAFLKRFPTVFQSLILTVIVIFGFLSTGAEGLSTNSPLVVTSLVAMQRLGAYLSIIGQKLTEISNGTAQINSLLKQIKPNSKERGKRINLYGLNRKNLLSLNNITFNYGNDEKLLENLNTEFRSGNASIILGPSGSGKSTLFSLLLKECKPLSGEIKINNYSLNEISKSELYKNLSFVSQSPFIFETTISNNIKFGNIDSSFKEIEEASKKSGAFEFIDKLPKKYNFEVFDSGTNLSGGQCQLISLTRAILKDAPIVFLDEPSNNLDNTSVNKLKLILSSWASKNKIIIVITHDKRLIDEKFNIYEISKNSLIKLE